MRTSNYENQTMKNECAQTSYDEVTRMNVPLRRVNS